MAWFSKPKHAEPVAPARCARCRARPGTALFRFVAAPDAPLLERVERTAWLRDACQDEVRREAADN